MACCRQILRRSLTPDILRTVPRLSPTSARLYSEKIENIWKDGAIVYSTSKASKHRVNSTIGLETERKISYKPIIFGVITFTVLMYAMFIYDGEKNDVFMQITPESVKEEYLKSINPGSKIDEEKNEKDEKQ